MRNFTVVDRPTKRFDSDFQVNPNDGYQPTEEEQDYIRALEDALEGIATDVDRDQRPPFLSPSATEGRQKARQAAVRSLKSDAESDLTATDARKKIEEIGKNYQDELRKFPDGNGRFEVKGDPSRFTGYFRIQPLGIWRFYLENQDYADESKNEREYQERVEGLLNDLYEAANRDQDTLDKNSPRMLAHDKARERVAGELAEEVEAIGITLTAKDAIPELSKHLDKYNKDIDQLDQPILLLEDRAEAETRFSSDFKLAVVRKTDSEDLNRDYYNYVSQVRDILRLLAADEASDKAQTYADSIREQRTGLRTAAAQSLRKDADAVSKGAIHAITATDVASTLKGRYLRDLELASGTLFTIAPAADERGLAIGIAITVSSHLPPPNNIASPEKQELYTAILAAQNVIMTVCSRIESGDDKTLCGRMFARQPETGASERAGLLRDEYLRKLVGIGKLGLEGPNTTLAKVALESLRSGFVAHEGPRIKNSYVCRLGLACAVAAAVFLLVYALIATGYIEREFWKLHRPFLLAGVGAAIGTWLSFSIREVQLSFDHLGVVEADLLDPAFRVLFVVALTITACLLFWTGVMNIEIGNLKTTPPEFKKLGTIALLVGLFCGLSERTLATSISGRAATFVKGLSG